MARSVEDIVEEVAATTAQVNDLMEKIARSELRSALTERGLAHQRLDDDALDMVAEGVAAGEAQWPEGPEVEIGGD